MKKVMTTVAVVTLLIGLQPILAQPGKGGPKNGNQRPPARFTFSSCGSGPCITSDGFPGIAFPYEDEVDHVKARFVPTGNPILDLRNRKSPRFAQISWGGLPTAGGCEPVGQGVVPTTPQIFLSHTQLWDEDTMDPIEDRFLGMWIEQGIGQVGFSRLGISFAPEERKAEGWAIRFDEEYGARRVKVTRLSDQEWQVTSTYATSTGPSAPLAAIGRVANGAFSFIRLCPFQLDFTVECLEGCPPAAPPPAP